MFSYSGSVVSVPTTQQAFGPKFAEGPWVYKRNSTYYNVFAANCCPEDIRYSTAPSATGPWTYRGVVMATEGGSFTNHPAVIDYKGGSYFFYHNGALPGGSGYTRSIAVEKFNYGSDGSIPTMKMTEAGAPQVGSLDQWGLGQRRRSGRTCFTTPLEVGEHVGPGVPESESGEDYEDARPRVVPPLGEVRCDHSAQRGDASEVSS